MRILGAHMNPRRVRRFSHAVLRRRWFFARSKPGVTEAVYRVHRHLSATVTQRKTEETGDKRSQTCVNAAKVRIERRREAHEAGHDGLLRAPALRPYLPKMEGLVNATTTCTEESRRRSSASVSLRLEPLVKWGGR